MGLLRSLPMLPPERLAIHGILQMEVEAVHKAIHLINILTLEITK